MGYRLFSDKQLLKQMLTDRQAGYSLPALMHKYNLRSHRSVIYWCDKYNVKPKETTILYHAIDPYLLLTIRRIVHAFPLEEEKQISFDKINQQLTDRTAWWAVEQYVREHKITSTPMLTIEL